MKGTTVEVCTDQTQCSQCGKPTEVATSRQWATFTCDPPITGNEVKVIQNNNYAAFCEVEILGDSGKKIVRLIGFHNLEYLDLVWLLTETESSNKIKVQIRHETLI